MALYNLFVKEVLSNTWNAEGGTAFECIGKTEVEPGAPTTATKLKFSSPTGVKFEVNFDTTTGSGLALKELLEKGGKVTAATIHIYGKVATAASKSILVATNAPIASGEPEVSLVNEWMTVAFPEAQAKELTAANLASLVATVELILKKSTSAYEIYLSVEAEAESKGGFPTVEVLDSFQRANEKPLSNGGKWSAVEEVDLGELVSEAWQPYSTESYGGAYWNAKQFTEPGIAVEVHHLAAAENNLRIFMLESPSPSGEKGYVWQINEEGVSTGKFSVALERRNVGATLASKAAVAIAVGDHIGLSVVGGKVIGWRKKGAGAWEEILSVADATYTKGYIGFFARKSFTLRNFEGPSSRKESETFAAKLEGQGALPRNTTHAFTTPSLSPQGTTSKQFAFAKAFIASLSTIGSTTKAFVIAKALVASQTFQGTIKRAFSLTKSLSAKLTFTGKLAKGLSIGKAFTAALSFTGNVATKAGIFGQTLTASIGFKGTTKKAFSFARKLVASLSPSGAFTAGRELIVQRLTAGLSFVGSLVGKKPIQTWTMPGSVARAARAIGSIRRTNQPQPPRKSEDV